MVKRRTQEQKFLAATAELILTDLINIAMNGVQREGAGSLVINLQNDSTTFMSGNAIEYDIAQAERMEDEEILEFLRGVMEEIDENDWSKNVLITLIIDAEQEHLQSKQEGAKKASERSQQNLQNKLAEKD